MGRVAMKAKLIKHFIKRLPGAWICQCGYGEFGLSTKAMLKHILTKHGTEAKAVAAEMGWDGDR